MTGQASQVSAATLGQPRIAVDGGGQATYAIDIDVPAGIAGAQPALSLRYSHGQPNDVLGVGWTLGGLSAITRVKATYAVDGFNGSVAYDDRDRLALDGQRLINVDGEYGAPGTVYETELQSWNHVEASHEGFTVTSKSGARSEYGTTPDSRIMAAGGSAVRVWALSATIDHHGNRVQYHYTLAPDGIDGDSGAYYADRISYTSRADGTADANRYVDFAYERRPDPIVSYIGGHPVTLLYRMTAVVVSVQTDVVRTYELGYATTAATALSVIETITLSGAGADPPSLPPTTLTWQDVDGPTFEIGPLSNLDQHLSSAPDVRQMDVTGSGRSDLVALWSDSEGYLCATSYLATPTVDGTTYVSAGTSTLGSFSPTREILPMDVDGDGRTDLVVAYASGPDHELKLAVFLSDGAGSFTDAGTFATGDYWTAKHLAFFAMDANGDGRTDVVEAYGHHDPSGEDVLYLRSYLSLFRSGDGTFTPAIVSATDDPAVLTDQLAFWPLDVNGDGMMDLARVWLAADGRVRVTTYISVSRAIDDASFDGRVESDLGAFSLQDQIAFLPVDVNGDGTQDLLQIWREDGQTSTLHFTTFLSDAAGGFVAGPDSTFVDQSLTPGEILPMDIDGAGATAIVGRWQSGDSLMFTPFRASPSGAYRQLPAFDAGVAGIEGDVLLPGDANGDGKADALRLTIGADHQIQVVPYLSAGDVPDLVASIVNPLGGRADIAYAPLSDATVYSTTSAAGFPAGSGRRFPNPMTPTWFPAQNVIGRALRVVSRTSESSDSDHNRFAYAATTTFTYADARIDLEGRGWQGFRETSRVEETTGSVTTTTYAQDYPFTGRVVATAVAALAEVDPRVPAGSPPALLRVTQTTHTSEYTSGSETDPSSAVVQVLRSARRVLVYDYGIDRFDYARGHRYEHDGYGNETLDANLGYIDVETGEPLDPDEVVYRHRSFQNDVGDDGWALGYLRYEKVTANAVDPDIATFANGDLHLRQRVWTSTTYDLASDGRWNDVAGSFLTTSYAYDEFGNRSSETKPGGYETTFAFDPTYHTFPMSTTSPADADGSALVVHRGYDPRFGVEVAYADANGAVWVSDVDAFGRPARRQGPATGGDTHPNVVTPLVTGTPALHAAFTSASVLTIERRDYLDDGSGAPRAEVSALQKFPAWDTAGWAWTRTYVDGLGRGRQRTRQTGQAAGDVVILTDFDANDMLVRESLPFFSTTEVVATAPHTTVTQYDALSRPIARRVPTGPGGEDTATTTWSYGAGQVVTRVSGAGSSAAYTESFEHRFLDDEDHVRRVTVDPDGAAEVTTFAFDRIGRLLRATDPATATSLDGITNTMTYDSLDNRLTLDNPDQNTTSSTVAMTSSFDPVTGLLAEQVDAAGAATTYAYDGLGRVVLRSLPDGRTVAYTYDEPNPANGLGRVCVVTVYDGDDVQSIRSFAYDSWGNAVSTTLTVAGDASTFVIERVFDPQRRLVRQTLPDGSMLVRRYAYARLVSQVLGQARVDYPLENFSPWGKPGRMNYLVDGGAETVATTYTFNPSGQVEREQVTSGGTVILDVTYTYDVLDQLISAKDAVDVARSQDFAYERKRLVKAEVGGLDPAVYDYDASGNLVAGAGVTYDYDAHFPVRGSADGEQVYAATRDACGRTATRTTETSLAFDYDGFGSLCRASDADGSPIVEMLSDHEGALLRRTIQDGTTTLIVDASYHVERDSDGTETIKRYLLDARGTVAALSGPQTGLDVRYLRRDFKGSNTHVFGAAGIVVTELAYDGYGRAVLVAGTDDLDRRYEDRSWDRELGLYYFGARYYDPVRGRFLTPDSRLGSDAVVRADALNRFAFELNNPINSVDPTGHSSDWIWGLVLGGVVVVGGVALILVTGGAATPAVVTAGAVVGSALFGAGTSAAVYSASHRDVDNRRQFWGGWAVNGVVGGVVGGLSAGAGSLLSTGMSAALANVTSAGVQLAARGAAYVVAGAALTAGGDAFGQFMSNVVDREILKDERVGLGDGVAYAAAIGAGAGAIGGAVTAAVDAKVARRVAGSLDSDGVELPKVGPGDAAAGGVEVREPFAATLRRGELAAVIGFSVTAAAADTAVGSSI